jgi:N-acetylglutamate synthase-like GNAT family acetyltransferase
MSLAAEPVTGSDAGLRTALLDARLPVDDLDRDGRRFFRFVSDGRVVGYGGYEPHGEHALIRSVVVLPEARGRGYGRGVAALLLEEAGKSGARDAYLLTDTAEAFFGHLGFTAIDRAEAPTEILATPQAASICSTAPLMRVRISA